MTREEEIEKEAYRQEDLVNMDAESFIEGAKWADTHPKSPWISTDKYLPKQGGHYLCNDGYNHISMLAFCGDKWVNSRAFDDIPLDSVKYWMCPPRLPEQEI